MSNESHMHFKRRIYQTVAVSIAFSLTIFMGCGIEKVETPASPQPGIDTKSGTVESVSEKSAAVKSSLGIEMVAIPGGEFVMGNDNGEEDERPAHTVKLDAFYMDVYEVTQESFEALTGTNPSKHKNPKAPVEQLGWLAAMKYCNLRSLKEGLTPCFNIETQTCDFSADGYRLPTEAEWEYACRAGATGDYPFAGGENKLSEAAWFSANASNTTHPVGQKSPNAWGLYDMCGNVFEWCHDVYSESYYAEAPQANPCNIGEGDERVLRGGAWNSSADLCRSSARYSEAPGLADVCFGYDAYGFRCVKRAAP